MYEESGGRAAPVLAERYRLITLIGRGGTARVLRAWDERLDRPVAIKIFQPHADPVGRLRFEDEARLLASFDHPRLVKVFDSGVANGEPFLVLELIDGPQLGRRIDQGPMASDEVRKIGIELAEALAYVHSRGVVHRDVKPGNILLAADGMPRLADFGLAKLLARSGITASDRLVGTAAYLSPEQVLGTEVGPPADVYGLGLILLECVTGEVEYPGLDAETVLARLNRRPRIPDNIPDALAEVLEAMTRSEPADRPDATACAEMLRANRPTVPIPRPRRSIGTKVAVVLGAGLTAGAIGLVLASPTTDGNPPGLNQPNRGVLVDSTIGSGTPRPQQPDNPSQPSKPGSSNATAVADRNNGPTEPAAQNGTTPTVADTADKTDAADAANAQNPKDPKDPRHPNTRKPKDPPRTKDNPHNNVPEP